MALRGYLLIPDILGESQVAGHEEEIEVWGLDWGIEQPAPSSSRFRRRARPDPRALQVFKIWDKSSVYIADAAARGKVFPEVILSVRKDSGETHLDYLVITMTNVLVADYDMHHTEYKETDPSILERFSLEYERIKFIHTELGANGAAGHTHEIDIADGRS